MSTYLLYQTLAYLGTQASASLAALPTGGTAAREQVDGVGRLLGRIEVLVPASEGGWVSAGSAGETGPLGPDTKVVPLPRTDEGPIRVRLQLTRGLWRIDYLALAQLGDPFQPGAATTCPRPAGRTGGFRRLARPGGHRQVAGYSAGRRVRPDLPVTR